MNTESTRRTARGISRTILRRTAAGATDKAVTDCRTKEEVYHG